VTSLYPDTANNSSLNFYGFLHFEVGLIWREFNYGAEIAAFLVMKFTVPGRSAAILKIARFL
jgi:hypothetical protein